MYLFTGRRNGKLETLHGHMHSLWHDGKEVESDSNLFNAVPRGGATRQADFTITKSGMSDLRSSHELASYGSPRSRVQCALQDGGMGTYGSQGWHAIGAQRIPRVIQILRDVLRIIHDQAKQCAILFREMPRSVALSVWSKGQKSTRQINGSAASLQSEDRALRAVSNIARENPPSVGIRNAALQQGSDLPHRSHYSDQQRRRQRRSESSLSLDRKSVV